MKRVAIIGGGIAGLAAGHRVKQLSAQSNLPLQITIFESANRLGGIIDTTERDGFLLERGPDSFLTEKPDALRLVEELELTSRLQPTNANHRRSFIVRNGRLIPIPADFHLIAPARFWPFINSEIVSWPAKARMALDLVLPAKKTNGRDDESLAAFIRRRLGKEALERVAQPMVGGIYTANPETLSLQATMPRFLEMEREAGSVIRGLRKRLTKNASSEKTKGARYGLFVSFDSGMRVFSDAVAASLGDAEILLGKEITSVDFDRVAGQWRIAAKNEGLMFDAVCLALPAYVSATLLSKTDATLSRLLNGINYESSATINLAYRREDISHPLDGFGFVVPFIEKRSLIACSFSSVKFANRAPADHVLLRAFVGGALQLENFQLEDQEMVKAVQSDLRELLGIRSQPLFSEISRWPKAMPQYELGHLQRVAQIHERVGSLPGLTLAGNAYAGVGLPDCVRSGEEAAKAILDFVEGAPVAS
ncbi:MAG TPA: protoporphyrinogen oxidase [Pyrinomonadaceae bacterium]|nr:protoporphyrinogen oxidase [Pyrinomonadaceae bacterium]